jgi:hypothetical protein
MKLGHHLRMKSGVSAFIVCALFAPPPAWSQEPVRANEGNTIRLQLRDATQLQARLISIRSDSLVIQRYIDAPLSTVARADVSELHVRMPSPQRGRAALKGGLAGALVGAATLVVLMITFDDGCYDCDPVSTSQKLLGAGAYVGSGAALGALGGWALAKPVWQPARF